MLCALLSAGKHAAGKLKRVQTLLAAHTEQDSARIAATLSVSESTVYRVKRRFVELACRRRLPISREQVRSASSAAKRRPC